MVKAEDAFSCRKLPSDAVIHSFRHTLGTRLGESGADTFTIMRAMGDSSAVVSQKYVHPTPEAMERAIEPLNAANEKAMAPCLEARSRCYRKPTLALQLTPEKGWRPWLHIKPLRFNVPGWRNWQTQGT